MYVRQAYVNVRQAYATVRQAYANLRKSTPVYTQQYLHSLALRREYAKILNMFNFLSRFRPILPTSA